MDQWPILTLVLHLNYKKLLYTCFISFSDTEIKSYNTYSAQIRPGNRDNLENSFNIYSPEKHMLWPSL